MQRDVGFHRSIGVEPRSPEFIRFDVVIDGKTRRAILSGGIYRRVFKP
jgi:hypothetical protein